LSRRGPRNARSVQMRSRAATGRRCRGGVFKRASQGRPRLRSGLRAPSQVQIRDSGFESCTNNSWMIASKVRVVGPREVIEAGPSKLSEHPGPSRREKEGSWSSWRWAPLRGAKHIGMLDEHWGARQRFLADSIFNKRLEIEVLFKEIAAIEVMMQE
jgi:hypothetical protein